MTCLFTNVILIFDLYLYDNSDTRLDICWFTFSFSLYIYIISSLSLHSTDYISLSAFYCLSPCFLHLSLSSPVYLYLLLSLLLSLSLCLLFSLCLLLCLSLSICLLISLSLSAFAFLCAFYCLSS